MFKREQVLGTTNQVMPLSNLDLGGNLSMNNMDLVNQIVGSHVGCNRMVRIGAACVVQIGARFFLLVELEIGMGANEMEQVLVIEISAALFNALRNAGVMVCEIRNTVPTPPAGSTLELQCTFIVGNEAFIIFEIENMQERLVIVRSPLCTII